MPPKFALVWGSLFAALLAFLSPSAEAADLPQYPARNSRLGAVFAEPSARTVRVETIEPADDGALLFVPPKVPGYYGRATDFTYRNYYGTSPVAIFGRLPYACGYYGYC